MISRSARQNSRWGSLQIDGQLTKVGVTISKTSVATVLCRHHLPPTSFHVVNTL